MNAAPEIQAVLRAHSMLNDDARAAVPDLWPNSQTAELAADWAFLGFTASEVDAWLHARCFSPNSARDLNALGITPVQAATVTTAGAGEPDTIGFKVSASQLLPADAIHILSMTTLPDDAYQRQAIRSEQAALAVEELSRAAGALLDHARSGPLDPATSARTVDALLEAIRTTGLSLSYLARNYQQQAPYLDHASPTETDPEEDARRLAENLTDLAAKLTTIHHEHQLQLANELSPSGLRLRQPTANSS